MTTEKTREELREEFDNGKGAEMRQQYEANAEQNFEDVCASDFEGWAERTCQAFEESLEELYVGVREARREGWLERYRETTEGLLDDAFEMWLEEREGVDA